MSKQVKEKAKELCEKSGCHHKCHDTSDCVVEEEALLLINENKSNNFDVKSNEELFKQALVEGVNRHIDKTIEEEKKIEEMAYEMTQYKGKMCERIEHNKCLLKFHAHAFIDCNYCKLAEHLITEKNYRKQSEGKWIGEADGYADGELVYDVWHCSECNHCIDDGTDDAGLLPNYCPNCGAKMKGE